MTILPVSDGQQRQNTLYTNSPMIGKEQQETVVHAHLDIMATLPNAPMPSDMWINLLT